LFNYIAYKFAWDKVRDLFNFQQSFQKVPKYKAPLWNQEIFFTKKKHVISLPKCAEYQGGRDVFDVMFKKRQQLLKCSFTYLFFSRLYKILLTFFFNFFASLHFSLQRFLLFLVCCSKKTKYANKLRHINNFGEKIT
jgi:hypothetical protein